jgi:hypothetical protein
VRRFLKAREKRFRFGVRIGMLMEISCEEILYGCGFA